MRRLQVRVSLLTVLWLAVGIILFSVLWAILRGASETSGTLRGLGELLFFVGGAVFAGEINMALRAVNFRVDDRVRHGTAQDACIRKIAKSVGIGCDDSPPAPDPRPREIAVFPRE